MYNNCYPVNTSSKFYLTDDKYSIIFFYYWFIVCMFIIVMVFGNFSEFNNQVLVKIILNHLKFCRRSLRTSRGLTCGRVDVTSESWPYVRSIDVGTLGTIQWPGQQRTLWMLSHLVGTEDVEGYCKPEGEFHCKYRYQDLCDKDLYFD